MKKIGITFFVLIVLAIAFTYILIPANIIVSEYVYIKVRPTSTVRYLHNEDSWQHWFPGKVNTEKKFVFDNNIYELGKETYTSLSVIIFNNNNHYSSEINVIPIGADSSAVQWQFQFAASNNPLKRVKQYQTAKRLHDNIAFLLSNFKLSSVSTKNIYGFDIKLTTLTDTTLVSLKATLKQYPSTQVIYEMIDELQQYIKQQQAVQHNYPMLNVTQEEDSSYKIMVGIPTNISLPGNNIIEPKRMIMLKNKTLVTDVTGNLNTINKAFQATNNYMSDHELSSPVIPFQQLVTDRSKEQDSTKWITRIFTPII